LGLGLPRDENVHHRAQKRLINSSLEGRARRAFDNNVCNGHRHRCMQQLTHFNEHIRSNEIRSNVEKRLNPRTLKDRKDV